MNWKKEYADKIVSADQAVSHIKSGDRIFIGHVASFPALLEEAMIRGKKQFRDVEIIQMFTLSQAAYCLPEHQDVFKYNSLFVGASTRKVIAENRCDFTPCYFYRIPELFKKNHIKLNVAMVQVSAPDENGLCSYGLNNDCTKAAVESADLVLAELNDQYPYTYGDNYIHMSNIDYVVDVSYPVPSVKAAPITDVELKIGEYCASLIEDGSTLQLGIGGIPNAVLASLKNKKDLGVHTEMLSDGVIDLVQAGIITGSRKSIHKGEILCSFILGSQRLYDFVNRNKMVQVYPVDYVNNPLVIMKNYKFVSINSCVEIDLAGQVASEAAGRRQVSGVGGQVDFIRGAAMAENGKSILAMTSTAQGGSVSRIVATLAEGSYITTNRHDVEYIVTEYGIAHLFGKSLRQRAEALISIAHPDFRNELAQEFKTLKS